MDSENQDEAVLELEQKIKNIAPFFDTGIRLLKEFSESVLLSDNEKIFEVSERVINPDIILLDDPYPNIQCKKSLFFKRNKIEVSYGIFAILGMLGEFEDSVKEITMYGLPYKAVWESKKAALIHCVKDVLNYLKRAHESAPGAVPQMPKMTVHPDIFYEALRFIIGHELSHYLDPYFNFDYREIQRNDVRDICLSILNNLTRTRYKKYADDFFYNLSDDPDERELFYKNMVEEVLADYEGYIYLWYLPNDPYKIVRHNTGISIAYIALRLMEYFESTLNRNSIEKFSVPIKWREFFLISVLYKLHKNQFDSIPDYIDNEWGPYQLLDSLFEQIIFEIESENGSNIHKQASMKTNEEYSREMYQCYELIEKLKNCSPWEVEDVFCEINKIFDDNSLDDFFYHSFPAKELAEALCKIGYAFYECKIYDAAYLWWFRAVTYFDVSDSPDRLLEADCYYYLGEICFNDGHAELAASWYEQALAIRRNHPNLSFESSVELYLHLVEALIDCKKFEAAKNLLQEMLAETKNESILKEIYRQMGIICDNLDDNEGALDWFSKALSIVNAMNEPDSSESATFYNSIGIIHYNTENYDEAEKYLKKAYEIKKNKLDPDDISLTNTMYSIGNLEAKKKRYATAIEWFEKVLEIRERTLGENHPRVADTYQSLGAACYYNQDLDKALTCQKRAYNIYKSTLGREHMSTIIAENNIELCIQELAKERE